MTAKYGIQHLSADNDRNGNPRRCYVVIDLETGNIVDVYDEGYKGPQAVPADIRQLSIELPSYAVSANEYRYHVNRKWETEQ